MADETTPRLGLPIYTSGTDLHPTREDFNDRMELLEEAVAIARQGTREDRPLPSARGTLFMETDTRLLWFDTGDEWIRVLRVGNDGPGRSLDIGGGGAEGESEWAARADHTHPLPLATASQPGALSATDKALLNTASANATSNALARRNGSGQMSAAAPSAASHVAPRSYVDQQVNTRAPSSHSHNADDVDRGTLAPERLPAATQSQRGAMSSSDKRFLDEATVANTPGTLVRRGTQSGTFSIDDPANEVHAANKRYVDALVHDSTWDRGWLSQSDLNDVTTPGQYVQEANGNATAARNYPVSGTGGGLTVASLGANFRFQKYLTRGGAKYERRYSEQEGWSSWERTN